MCGIRVMAPARGQAPRGGKALVYPVVLTIYARGSSMDERDVGEASKRSGTRAGRPGSIPRCRRAARSCARTGDMVLPMDSLTPDRCACAADGNTPAGSGVT